MELVNEFSVGVPVDEAWHVLTDLRRVAPCMPGFELQEVDGGEYRGVVKVKVGPMVAQYRGVATFRELDEAGRRAVVRAEGRETRGQGHAAATVTATLAPVGGGTHVTLHTDLAITGKVAQFGRGVLADVSRKLLGQFVEALEADVLAGLRGGAPGAARDHRSDPRPAGERAVHGVPPVTAEPEGAAGAPAEPVDLWAAAGPSLLKRAVPLVLALAAGLAAWALLAR